MACRLGACYRVPWWRVTDKSVAMLLWQTWLLVSSNFSKRLSVTLIFIHLSFQCQIRSQHVFDAHHLHRLAVHEHGTYCMQFMQHIVLLSKDPENITRATASMPLTLHLFCDGATGELEDSMESFFLSETSKYLFLLQANATYLPDHYIFTTEGHLLPPFISPSPQPPPTSAPASQHAAWVRHLQRACYWLLPDLGQLWMPLAGQSSEGSAESGGPQSPSSSSKASAAAEANCDSLCSSISDADMQNRQHLLQASLPLLPLSAQDAVIIRQAFGYTPSLSNAH